jgi:cell division ATPase FtsA
MATPDTEFMTAISAITGDFSLVLQVLSNDVIRSTGMVAIPSGIITVSDVGRVLEVATSLPCRDDVFMCTSPTYHFLVDGTMRTKLMPIGMPAKRLEVTVALIRINEDMLRRWRGWAAALGRNIVSWRIEEV